MSEETTDNVAPVTDNAAPVQEGGEATTQATGLNIEKFGDLLSYASDDIKEAGTWNKFKDVDMPTALKAIVDMDKWTGKRGDIPQADATDEDWKSFWSKVGVPEDVSGYEYALSDEMKTGLGDEAEGLSQYIDHAKGIAHKYNIPAKAMDGFLSEMMQHEIGLRTAGAESQQEQFNARQAMLDSEWGDARNEMAQAVQNLEKHYGISEEMADVIESNPETLILLGKIAKDLDEKGQAGNAFSNTKIGLQDELSDVEGRIQAILRENRGDVNDKRLTSLFERKRRLDHKLA